MYRQTRLARSFHQHHKGHVYSRRKRRRKKNRTHARGHHKRCGSTIVERHRCTLEKDRQAFFLSHLSNQTPFSLFFFSVADLFRRLQTPRLMHWTVSQQKYHDRDRARRAGESGNKRTRPHTSTTTMDFFFCAYKMPYSTSTCCAL